MSSQPMTIESLSVQNVFVSAGKRGKKIEILRGVTLKIPRGALVLVRGATGGGKSTLLEVIAGLRRPDSGSIKWGKHTLYAGLRPKEVDRLRTSVLGILFQDYKLCSHLSGWENIFLPSMISGTKRNEDLIHEMVAMLFPAGKGTEILSRKVMQLSGGEKERVALLRAFAHRPPFILADEMLSSIDPELKERIWPFIKKMCRSLGIGLLLISHDRDLLEDEDFDLKCVMEKGVLSDYTK